MISGDGDDCGDCDGDGVFFGSHNGYNIGSDDSLLL